MAFPRYQHNLLVLPDGPVFAVGGSTIIDQSSHSGTLAAEIWNPITETWSSLASMRDPRMYHSTAVLLPDGRGYRLSPGACGLIPVGMKHAWLGPASGTARWIDMNAPCPKGENFADDTYFLGPAPSVAIADFDIRDPSSRHLFRMADDDIKVDAVRTGLKKDAPKVSASMATALLVYSGITVKMMVDSDLGAQLATMFMVQYQPAGVAGAHDHPLEETYLILEGEVFGWFDGVKYHLKPGDCAWARGLVREYHDLPLGALRRRAPASDL